MRLTTFEILTVKCVDFNSPQMRRICTRASHLSCPKGRSYSTVTLKRIIVQ